MTTTKQISFTEYDERPLSISPERWPDCRKLPLETQQSRREKGAIVCPFCTFATDMHQDAYEIFARQCEDGKATRIAVDNADCTSSPGPTEPRVLIEKDNNNAPGRRDSLAVRFLCTNCYRPSVLRIQQHKGAAHIWFEDPNEQIVLPDPKNEESCQHAVNK